MNGSEAMQHQAGLSDGFWEHTVKAKIHMYNVMVQLEKVEICEL